MPEPRIDPLTGKPIVETPSAEQFVPKGEFDVLRQRLDTFERNAPRMAPQQPQAPSGPTVTQQLTEIDTKIAALDTKIDEAVSQGKPVSTLLKERSTLERKSVRMQIKAEDIDPAMAAGIQTIDQLSDAVTRGSMPHLSLVKDDYEQALASLLPEQRMNPRLRKAAYDIAVGQNIDKITASEKEKILREQSTPPPPPSNQSGRGTGTAPGGIPKPEEVLSKDALAAIRSRGFTVDEYYKRIGHKEGWKGFWEKSGKTYFGDTTAEQ